MIEWSLAHDSAQRRDVGDLDDANVVDEIEADRSSTARLHFDAPPRSDVVDHTDAR